MQDLAHFFMRVLEHFFTGSGFWSKFYTDYGTLSYREWILKQIFMMSAY